MSNLNCFAPILYLLFLYSLNDYTCLYLEMDKSWIKLPRNTPEYLVGLNNFLDFAFQYGASANTIVCDEFKFLPSFNI